jgi:G3E family GTPase
LADGGATPVTLLTGFLGSGKTTLLSRLLAHPDMGETAVIVNELGEVAIDHHLLRRVDERTVLLKSGCVCCSLRGDLADELRDLLGRRERGEIPAFRRVVVETTGLADPAPIVYTLLSEPVVKHHFRLERVIATVDAVNGLRAPESVRQVAAADRLVVTKTDLPEAGDVTPVPRLRRAARLGGVRDLADDAAGEPRERRAAREGAPERRRARAARRQRRPARRPPAGAPRRLARRGPPLADRLHRARLHGRGARALARGVQPRGGRALRALAALIPASIIQRRITEGRKIMGAPGFYT